MTKAAGCTACGHTEHRYWDGCRRDGCNCAYRPTETAPSHVRDHDARRGSGHPRRADRSAARGPAHDDTVRPGQGEPGQARQLHPRGLHGRSDLDRHADALATLAGFVRRAFIREAGR